MEEFIVSLWNTLWSSLSEIGSPRNQQKQKIDDPMAAVSKLSNQSTFDITSDQPPMLYSSVAFE